MPRRYGRPSLPSSLNDLVFFFNAGVCHCNIYFRIKILVVSDLIARLFIYLLYATFNVHGALQSNRRMFLSPLPPSEVGQAERRWLTQGNPPWASWGMGIWTQHFLVLVWQPPWLKVADNKQLKYIYWSSEPWSMKKPHNNTWSWTARSFEN